MRKNYKLKTINFYIEEKSVFLQIVMSEPECCRIKLTEDLIEMTQEGKLFINQIEVDYMKRGFLSMGEINTIPLKGQSHVKDLSFCLDLKKNFNPHNKISSGKEFGFHKEWLESESIKFSQLFEMDSYDAAVTLFTIKQLYGKVNLIFQTFDTEEIKSIKTYYLQHVEKLKEYGFGLDLNIIGKTEETMCYLMGKDIVDQPEFLILEKESKSFSSKKLNDILECFLKINQARFFNYVIIFN